MKLRKLARDVHSNELTESERNKLAKLWSLPSYRLPLIDGLCLRDAALDHKPLSITKGIEHLGNNFNTGKWAHTGLPILLFPTELAEL
jgi:hypothetical protein